MIPANSHIRHCTIISIGETYRVSPWNVQKWTKQDDFPKPVGKAGRAVLFDEDEVDVWLRRRQPGTWVRAHPGPNPFGLPEGRDSDLLTLEEIGELHGRIVLQREPTTPETLKTYISQGLLGRPDREPDDGQRPRVAGPRWFRSTAYAFLNTPRNRRRSRSEPAVAVQAPVVPADLVLPAGDDLDLLGLEEIREIDTAARGRPAPSAATLRTYMSGSSGRFPQPDRKPGDGLEPAVDEPKWYRATAYTFVRRTRGKKASN